MSGEHLIILGIVLVIFGPRRLPELGNSLGKAMRNFKDAMAGVEEAKYRKIDGEPNAQNPQLQAAQKAAGAPQTTEGGSGSDTPPSNDPASHG